MVPSTGSACAEPSQTVFREWSLSLLVCTEWSEAMPGAQGQHIGQPQPATPTLWSLSSPDSCLGSLPLPKMEPGVTPAGIS